jgi:hypothetical protein
MANSSVQYTYQLLVELICSVAKLFSHPLREIPDQGAKSEEVNSK